MPITELTGMVYIARVLDIKLPKNVSMSTQYLHHSQHIVFRFEMCTANIKDNLIQYSCRNNMQICYRYSCSERVYSVNKKVPFHMLAEDHQHRTVEKLLIYITPIAEQVGHVPPYIPEAQINRFINERIKKYV